ncbi:kinase-like domain-containing protein [Gigaspora rosea]|uniref:Kinase-like domain-containing protein n=1 Tax=Gigaspora rosea TaxID=44941 RepID=A0A397VAJ7_9GLOM|nr:kinase-like domain-containing protein [Gigaspora rosea]
MKWEDKLTLLHCIFSDLQTIHSKNIIHRDLHSGNVLQHNLHSAYIADLGLSISSNIALKTESGGVYGILPYIAPEILNGKPYTTASDIYSFGIIMWEILYGKSVFYNQNFGPQLQLEICNNNLRPIIIKNTPQCYINLMEKCWDKDPEKRPSAANICEIFTEWQINVKILLDLSESEEILKDVESMNFPVYPKTMYTSKFIYYTNSLCKDSKLCSLTIKD